MASAPPFRKRARSRSRWPAEPVSSEPARGGVEESSASLIGSKVRRFVPTLGGEREYLHARFRHAHRMLELGGQRAIARDGGPAVAQHLHAIAAQIDHGLDG